MSKAAKWRYQVRSRDKVCAAAIHASGCSRVGEHAHHICYKSQIPKCAYWVVANGIFLSELCHGLAHETHNQNISAKRKKAAVEAVNAVVPPGKPELRVPYFEDAA